MLGNLGNPIPHCFAHSRLSFGCPTIVYLSTSQSRARIHPTVAKSSHIIDFAYVYSPRRNEKASHANIVTLVYTYRLNIAKNRLVVLNNNYSLSLSLLLYITPTLSLFLFSLSPSLASSSLSSYSFLSLVHVFYLLLEALYCLV
jgi:hypothetical protein